ncbi:MAG: LD-carboxypeptidase [Flavobacteriaceae bacterium]
MKKLQKGDKIGICAPAGYIKKDEKLLNAISLLESWGLQVILSQHLFNSHGHFSGTDDERTKDFQTFLDDDNINAIWFARGGYGSIRIVENIDFTSFCKDPKWIIGYSDFTVFHQVINRLKLESIHAFMPTSSSTFKEENTAKESLRKALFGETLNYTIKPNKNNRLGDVKGEIIGGNLAIIASLLGTKHAINSTNKILFIEDIGEYKYRIDRMLRSLKLNGYFENCKGLILGAFTNIPQNDPDFGMSIETLILDVVKEYDFPICFDFPAGHIANNNALIFGKKSHLKITNNHVFLSN